MRLPPDQVDRFYAIWKPLLLFVNRRRELVPEMLAPDFEGPWPVERVKILRDALWEDDSLRRDFIAENPAGLSPADLAIVESWSERVAGNFFVLRHLKKYSAFLAEKGSKVYGVLGLASGLDEVLPFVPIYARAVLLPFEEVIIYDSLIVPYNISFGKGYRDSFERTYKDAKERGAIITSLLPSPPASSEEQQEAARATNAKVLDAFRTHLYRSGLSPKVVERDVANASELAEGYLLTLEEPHSLREFSGKQVKGYLDRLSAPGGPPAAKRKQALTSLKRFLRFLRDTERMEYDAAERALEVLKGR
jgi:hypothetical protein